MLARLSVALADRLQMDAPVEVSKSSTLNVAFTSAASLPESIELILTPGLTSETISVPVRTVSTPY